MIHSNKKKYPFLIKKILEESKIIYSIQSIIQKDMVILLEDAFSLKPVFHMAG